MISNQSSQSSLENPELQPISSYMFAPGIFFSANEENSFLSSLDIDTKNDLISHSDKFKTKQDIDNYINQNRSTK